MTEGKRKGELFMWLQKLPFVVKTFLYVLVVFALGTLLGAIISLIAEPNKEEVSGWCITLGYVVGFLITMMGGVSVEKSALHKMYERARAMKSNVTAIQERMENVILQMDALIGRHMEHEADVYLKVSKNDMKKFRHVKTMKDIRTSLSTYPLLRSDEDIMKLFGEISRDNDRILNAKLEYNECAQKYNAGIKSFPVSIFRRMFKMEPLECYQNPEG